MIEDHTAAGVRQWRRWSALFDGSVMREAASERRRVARAGMLTRGLLGFLGLTFAFSWAPYLASGAWRLGQGGRGEGSAAALAALLYLLWMGWPPVIAALIVRRWIDPDGFVDHGLRPGKPRHLAFTGVGTGLVVLAAALISLTLWAGDARLARAAPLARDLPHAPLRSALLASLSVLVTAVLTWLQSLAEEIGWRGYFLARLRERIGPVWALALHGLAWGCWYAPFLAAANQFALAPGVLGLLQFLVTATLLGALLGVIRLATGSIVPATLANACVTLLAGLPLILQGMDTGPRGAIFGPAGWLPLGAIAAALLCSRRVRRRLVQVGGPETPAPWGASRLLNRTWLPPSDTLH